MSCFECQKEGKEDSVRHPPPQIIKRIERPDGRTDFQAIFSMSKSTQWFKRRAFKRSSVQAYVAISGNHVLARNHSAADERWLEKNSKQNHFRRRQ